MKVRKIKESITHQGIGGCDFVIDEYITERLTNDEVFDQAMTGNFACWNFINRRDDFNALFPYKLYYGKVGNLGYVVAEDEFEK